jgi:hypothetical protein
MKRSRPPTATRLYTPRATLAAMGLKIRSLKLFETIADHVHIRQKRINHTPIEKLTDAFVVIISGAQGLCEVNTRLRSDVALKRAFGRTACAEQSVARETLSACTAENVQQMEGAMDLIFRAHSQTYRPNHQAGLLLLDVDLTGLLCGRRAETALKGYLRAHYGRQMGRVAAAYHAKVIDDRLYPGNLQLRTTVPHLVEAIEQALELDEAKRHRTVLQINVGGRVCVAKIIFKRGSASSAIN